MEDFVLMKALYTFDDSQYKLAIFLCHDALFLFFVYLDVEQDRRQADAHGEGVEFALAGDIEDFEAGGLKHRAGSALGGK